MSRKKPKRLVVDTDIARAAGETKHPVSSRCRQTLVTIKEVGHLIAFHPSGLKEWNKHRSRFSLIWLRAMYARKRVIMLDVPNHSPLQSALDTAPISEKNRKVIAKDLHLLDAALQTDRIVISKDDAAKNACALASVSLEAIREIGWVNPMDDTVDVIVWLKQGAKLIDALLLGK